MTVNKAIYSSTHSGSLGSASI